MAESWGQHPETVEQRTSALHHARFVAFKDWQARKSKQPAQPEPGDSTTTQVGPNRFHTVKELV